MRSFRPVGSSDNCCRACKRAHPVCAPKSGRGDKALCFLVTSSEGCRGTPGRRRCRTDVTPITNTPMAPFCKRNFSSLNRIDDKKFFKLLKQCHGISCSFVGTNKKSPHLFLVQSILYNCSFNWERKNVRQFWRNDRF